ncbi:hypothetical protein BaRGS_00019112, partial [Batillaria attramentaria]
DTQYMRNITVFVNNTQVYQYPTTGDIPLTPRVITPDPPLRGRVIKLTNGGGFVTLCELQLDACATGYYNKSESGDPILWDCIACGSGCSDTCDGQSGYCTCLPGWKPPFCDQASGHEGDSNTGAIVGSVVGVGLFLGICVLVGALLIIRSRRLPQPTVEHSETPRNSAAEGHEAATECRADLEATNGEGIGEQGDVSHNYDTARSYENADDIRFYTSLETNQPSTHGPQYANTTTATANYENLYVTTDNQYENIPNIKIM